MKAKKNKRDFFFSRETYTRIIVIDLIIVKLFRVCSMVFLFKRERVFSRKFCVLVKDEEWNLLDR